MREVIFFSNNENKIKEILSIFKSSSLNILSLNNIRKIKSPEEIGVTFEENAKIKSSYGYLKFNKICFGDDSGICIDALSGKPGVKSKEYLNSSKDTSKNLKKIISTAYEKKNFNAYFKTSVCLTTNNDKHKFFTGIIKGKISKQIRGEFGFGYDPIFIPDGYNKTFAEMSIDQKNFISHRSIAIRKLKKYLLSLLV